MAQLTEVNKDDFKANVVDSPVPVIVDFWAQWCGPCRKLSPVLEQIQAEFPNEIKVVKVNGDDNLEIMQEYGVMGLPTLLFFKGGEVKEIMVGMIPKSSIISNIKKLLEV